MELNSHIVKLQKDTEVHLKDTSKKRAIKVKFLLPCFITTVTDQLKSFLGAMNC